MSENLKVDRDITELIINKIKEKTIRKSIKINEEETSNLSIFDSKFGGLPYWDENMEYPTDKNGDALILLAQINFEKTPIKDERFPKEGILQFFIGTNDFILLIFDRLKWF